MRGQYIDGHEGLQPADCELPLRVLGEPVDAEVEPAFGVHAVAGFEAVVDAAQTVLGEAQVH